MKALPFDYRHYYWYHYVVIFFANYVDCLDIGKFILLSHEALMELIENVGIIVSFKKYQNFELEKLRGKRCPHPNIL